MERGGEGKGKRRERDRERIGRRREWERNLRQIGQAGFMNYDRTSWQLDKQRLLLYKHRNILFLSVSLYIINVNRLNQIVCRQHTWSCPEKVYWKKNNFDLKKCHRLYLAPWFKQNKWPFELCNIKTLNLLTERGREVP